MTAAAHDPLILAMVGKLPRADEVFTSGDRERWLAAMAAVFELLYPPEWSQDARRKARAASTVTVEPVTAERLVDAVMTLAQAKEEAASHLPDPLPVREYGAGLSEFDQQIETIRQHVEGTLREYGAGLKVEVDTTPLLHEEEPSTTSADAVDDASGGEATPDSGAGPAPDTSAHPAEPSPDPATGQDSSPTSPPTSEPTKPSSADPAPDKSETLAERRGIQSDVPVPGRIAPPQPNQKRHFTADQKGAILRRVVREGITAVVGDAMIHESTLRRWMREMPVSVATFTEEWEAECRQQAMEEGHPSVAELEAEKDKPVPPRMPEDMLRRATELAAKPAVQWPSGPIERRPFDPEQARSHQAGQS